MAIEEKSLQVTLRKMPAHDNVQNVSHFDNLKLQPSIWNRIYLVNTGIVYHLQETLLAQTFCTQTSIKSVRRNARESEAEENFENVLTRFIDLISAAWLDRKLILVFFI